MPMLAIIFTMPARTILTVEDERLRQPAAPAEPFSPELPNLVQDMFDTMRANYGVGLAGPQIGVMQRIFVAEIPEERDEQGELTHPLAGQTFVLLNPRLVEASADTAEGEEGCLSMPGWRGLVTRPVRVRVAAQDMAGQPLEITAEDYLARIFLHEMDHLDGVLYTDHISDQEKLWKVVEKATANQPG
ncbi:MAG: peptide deformylase [Anaerolineae bacterium]